MSVSSRERKLTFKQAKTQLGKRRTKNSQEFTPKFLHVSPAMVLTTFGNAGIIKAGMIPKSGNSSRIFVSVSSASKTDI